MRDKTVELRQIKGDMNPADLCTKYLPGFSKIASLTSLFNCHFRDGRAATAPKLRGSDPANAPLLSVQRGELTDSIEWDNTVYPAVMEDGRKLPEAFEHCHHILPHEHENLGDYFPKAMACDEHPEEAQEPEDELEKRGRTIGLETPQKGPSIHGKKENEPTSSGVCVKKRRLGDPRCPGRLDSGLGLCVCPVPVMPWTARLKKNILGLHGGFSVLA